MDNKNNSLIQLCFRIILIYVCVAVLFYAITFNQFKYRNSGGPIESLPRVSVTESLRSDTVVEQEFYSHADVIDEISIQVATYTRVNQGSLLFQLVNENHAIIYEDTVDTAVLRDNDFYNFIIEPPVTGVKNVPLCIRLTATTEDAYNEVALWYNPEYQSQNQYFLINGEIINGTLCYSVSQKEIINYMQRYLIFSLVLGVLLAAYFAFVCICDKKGKMCFGLTIYHAINKYRFLLNQLVSRDFKTKYKRSVLGVLWSFLNPLLSMSVQYVVFSTLFRSNIRNFQVYLLLGIVFFNYFSETTNLGLTSIVGNSSLITKVYIPKYIFPISRVLSSAINLALSLIPLTVVVIVSRIPITPSYLLFPYALICLIVFCIGMTFILSASMVFFRDTQFLWGVLIMLWMYATPIFYPETIIPPRFLLFYKMNPMYHFIKFGRITIMEGISPEPRTYIYCFLASFITFVIGALIFKKTQDKFILML